MRSLNGIMLSDKTEYKLYVFYDLNENEERKVGFKKTKKEGAKITIMVASSLRKL